MIDSLFIDSLFMLFLIGYPILLLILGISGIIALYENYKERKGES